jgi:hypothetical protein
MYKLAKKNLPNLPNFYLIYGKIVDTLINFDSLDDSNFRDHPKELKRTWFNEDNKNMKSTKNVLAQIPQKIDLLILDGGEFTSEIEFNLLKSRSRFIILDDTNDFCVKNRSAREEILANPTTYQIIMDDQNDRNGYLICENLLFLVSDE